MEVKTFEFYSLHKVKLYDSYHAVYIKYSVLAHLTAEILYSFTNLSQTPSSTTFLLTHYQKVTLSIKVVSY